MQNANQATPFPLKQIQLSLIDVKPQIRTNFNEETIAELGESIKEHGLVEPIVVKPKKDGEGYELIAGERRLRGAKGAGVLDLPTIIREDLVDQDTSVLQAIENLQRENLTLAEECAAVATLVAAKGFKETCKSLSKSAAWVSKRAGTKDMPDQVKKLLVTGAIEDLEVAHDLSKLLEIKPKEAENIFSRYQAIEDAASDEEELACCTPPPSRDSLRNTLRWAKEEAERKEEQRQAAAAAKNDPEAIKARDKAKKQAQSVKVKKDQMATRKTECAALVDQFFKAVYPAVGIKVPKRTTYGYDWDNAIRVKEPSMHQHSPSSIPKSVDVAKFTLTVGADLPVVEAVAKQMGLEPKVTLSFEDEITIDQARKVAAILGKAATFQFDIERTGMQLQALGERFSAKSGSAEEKPAVGKGAAAAEKQGDLTITAFLSECVDRKDSDAKVKAAEFYAVYVRWCKRTKAIALAFNDNAWGDAIAAAGIEKKRLNIGIHYIGCKLKVKK